MEKPNVEDLKKKIYERLVPSGWSAVLKSFLLSMDMNKILEQLIEQVNEGKHFTPKLSQVFRGFEECPYNKLKLVMILQD